MRLEHHVGDHHEHHRVVEFDDLHHTLTGDERLVGAAGGDGFGDLAAAGLDEADAGEEGPGKAGEAKQDPEAEPHAAHGGGQDAGHKRQHGSGDKPGFSQRIHDVER